MFTIACRLRLPLLSHTPLPYRSLVVGARRVRFPVKEHVSQVLAPQGHAIVVTARPEAAADGRFARFHRLTITPLPVSERLAVMTGRLGAAAAQLLHDYTERHL